MIPKEDWRPTNWPQIKQRILEDTPVVFSVSSGFQGDQKNQIMEKVASAILRALVEVDTSSVK